MSDTKRAKSSLILRGNDSDALPVLQVPTKAEPTEDELEELLVSHLVEQAVKDFARTIDARPEEGLPVSSITRRLGHQMRDTSLMSREAVTLAESVSLSAEATKVLKTIALRYGYRNKEIADKVVSKLAMSGYVMQPTRHDSRGRASGFVLCRAERE